MNISLLCMNFLTMHEYLLAIHDFSPNAWISSSDAWLFPTMHDFLTMHDLIFAMHDSSLQQMNIFSCFMIFFAMYENFHDAWIHSHNAFISFSRYMKIRMIPLHTNQRDDLHKHIGDLLGIYRVEVSSQINYPPGYYHVW